MCRRRSRVPATSALSKLENCREATHRIAGVHRPQGTTGTIHGGTGKREHFHGFVTVMGVLGPLLVMATRPVRSGVPLDGQT